jgi:hypothetical protein
MMNTCETCRYWDGNEEYFDHTGRCDGPAFIDAPLTELPRHRLSAVVSFEGMRITGRDFGCIHWQTKENDG